MSENTPYTPIDCSMHDELLALATLGTTCTISYFDAEQHSVTVESGIEDVYTEGQAEFLRTKEGTVIRLDRLERVNGLRFDNSSTR